VQTSTGVRCTIVGTPSDDVLRGTRHRDVICGRGGRDVIRGGRGNDLIDAGRGDDRVYGGSGDDRVLAGTGIDTVTGGRGNDHISGGGGGDNLYGGSGRDRLSGDGGGDEVFGGTGSDRLSGDGGNDFLYGGSGRDTISGGDGGDWLQGGSGADALDGGAGENNCADDDGDVGVHCYYAQDRSPPVIVETRISPALVDVTNAAARVTVTVHVTDDTGINMVQVQLHTANGSVQLEGSAGVKISGNLHDGWWRSTIDIHPGTPPGEMQPRVYATDGFKRTTSLRTTPIHVTVSDANPDTGGPQLTLLTPLGADPVDVRSGPVDVTVSVHATDDRSGLNRLDLCLERPETSDFVPVVCKEAVPRSSGTSLDGIWTIALQIPKGAAGGDWNVAAYVTDYSGLPGESWMGPDAYRLYDPRFTTEKAVAFPDGAGRVTVIGAADSTPAWADSMTVTPSEVDTFTNDAVIHVIVHALDASGEGVTRVDSVLVPHLPSAGQPSFDVLQLTRTAGTSVDGIWEGDLTLFHGTPSGRYDAQVDVTDLTHVRTFVGSGSSYATGFGFSVLSEDPNVVVVAHD
jgi:hypothetical protein